MSMLQILNVDGVTGGFNFQVKYMWLKWCNFIWHMVVNMSLFQFQWCLIIYSCMSYSRVCFLTMDNIFMLVANSFLYVPFTLLNFFRIIISFFIRCIHPDIIKKTLFFDFQIDKSGHRFYWYSIILVFTCLYQLNNRKR
jgi:hypothetical protein